MNQKIQGYLCDVNRHTVPAFIHNQDMKTVGQRIRDLRVAKKLTQEQLAKGLGIQQGSVTDLERGVSKSPASHTLTKLARFFEVDPEWLMTGKGSQHPVGALSEKEAELLLVYRALSNDGQNYVLGRARSIHKDEYDQTGKQRRFGKERPDGDAPNSPEGH